MTHGKEPDYGKHNKDSKYWKKIHGYDGEDKKLNFFKGIYNFFVYIGAHFKK